MQVYCGKQWSYNTDTEGVWKVMIGGPVELDSRSIRFRQVIHKRRPTASCGGEGKRLWLIVIHHFQPPVSVKWHGVT